MLNQFKTFFSILKKSNSQKGMTLVEIMIVLAILGTIIGLVATNVAESRDKAKTKEAKILVGQVSSILQMYYTDCGKYPDSLDVLGAGDSACPNWIPDSKAKKKTKDPWNRDLVYSKQGSEFVLKSLGKDGKEGGTGLNADIVSDDSAESGTPE